MGWGCGLFCGGVAALARSTDCPLGSGGWAKPPPYPRANPLFWGGAERRTKITICVVGDSRPWGMGGWDRTHCGGGGCEAGFRDPGEFRGESGALKWGPGNSRPEWGYY